jgi:LSD1 subclass zinc finger protein
MSQTAQIACNGCRTTLAYPVGATCVRCPLCRVTTFVNQVHIRCVTCSIQLALPVTAQLAQCPRCRTVMTMPRHPQLRMMPQQPNAAAQQRSQIPPPPPKHVVVIEQPMTQSPDGRLIKNTAIGTRIDDGVF